MVKNKETQNFIFMILDGKYGTFGNHSVNAIFSPTKYYLMLA